MSANEIVVPIAAVRRAALTLVVVAAVAVAGVLLWQQRERLGFFPPGIGDQLDRGAYQAVFLSGGLVFFGHAETHGADYLLLSDVFYFTNTEGGQTPAPGTGQLVKRGAELHGPRDPMLIPLRSVLFVENMRSDSDVVKAIARFKSGAPAPSVAPASPTASPPAPSGTARPTATR